MCSHEIILMGRRWVCRLAAHTDNRHYFVNPARRDR